MASDEHVMAEAIGRLTEERNQLQRELGVARSQIRFESRVKGLNSLLAGIFWIAVLGPFAWFLAKTIFSAISAPSMVSHCYVEWSDYSKERPFRLIGFVRYGQDKIQGTFPQIQDAVWAAKELGCPLRPAEVK